MDHRRLPGWWWGSEEAFAKGLVKALAKALAKALVKVLAKATAVDKTGIGQGGLPGAPRRLHEADKVSKKTGFVYA